VTMKIFEKSVNVSDHVLDWLYAWTLSILPPGLENPRFSHTLPTVRFCNVKFLIIIRNS
jgi:hypothetical protein